LLGVLAWLFLESLPAYAQEAPRRPLLAAPPRLVLTLPEPAAGSAAAADTSERWLLRPLSLTPSPLLIAALTATAPLQTPDGELSTYVAVAPLAQVSGVTWSAQGAVAPKLELDCRSTCQEQVEGSLALHAQVAVAGAPAQPNTAVFLRSEQVSARPNIERRLRVGVLGAF
jgi:hypothetical protein